ncbi:MAG: hypothetical protein AAB229_07330 [Candidatus Hydrogenedentota bacterium]
MKSAGDLRDLWDIVHAAAFSLRFGPELVSRIRLTTEDNGSIAYWCSVQEPGGAQRAGAPRSDYRICINAPFLHRALNDSRPDSRFSSGKDRCRAVVEYLLVHEAGHQALSAKMVGSHRLAANADATRRAIVNLVEDAAIDRLFVHAARNSNSELDQRIRAGMSVSNETAFSSRPDKGISNPAIFACGEEWAEKAAPDSRLHRRMWEPLPGGMSIPEMCVGLRPWKKYIRILPAPVLAEWVRPDGTGETMRAWERQFVEGIPGVPIRIPDELRKRLFGSADLREHFCIRPGPDEAIFARIAEELADLFEPEKMTKSSPAVTNPTRSALTRIALGIPAASYSNHSRGPAKRPTVLIDTSGSMVAGAWLSRIVRLSLHLGPRFFPSELYLHESGPPRRTRLEAVCAGQLSGGGGTSFDAYGQLLKDGVIDHRSSILHITDGCGSLSEETIRDVNAAGLRILVLLAGDDACASEEPLDQFRPRPRFIRWNPEAESRNVDE